MVSNDLNHLPFLAFARIELSPLKSTVDGYRAPFLEEPVATLCLRTPDGHVEVVGLLRPLATCGVLAARVDRHSE